MLVRPAGSSIVVNEEQPRKVLYPVMRPTNTFLVLLIPWYGKSHSAIHATMPPARARARRSLMADDDEPPTASTSALRSAWVDDPPFPPLPSAARNVSPAEVVVDAVAVMPAEGPADASAQHRAMHQRRAEAGRRKLWRRPELREEALRRARACACMQRSSIGSRKSFPRQRRSRRARCARTAMRQWRRRQRRKLPVHSTSS